MIDGADEPGPGARRGVTVDEGGDPACWLDRVCDGCGAVLDPARTHRCPAGPGPEEGTAGR